MKKGVCLDSFRKIVNLDNARCRHNVDLGPANYQLLAQDQFVTRDSHTRASFLWTVDQLEVIDACGLEHWEKTQGPRGYDFWCKTMLLQ